LEENYDAVVVGPGLGDFSEGLEALVSGSKVPMVVDADGLNFMAKKGMIAGEKHLLTPHPGEFQRLKPGLEGVVREEAARSFVAGKKAVLLLKGARTLVAAEGRALRVNSTGTPAMANGGQGDMLSGVLGALLAGGMARYEAACLGSWLCGRAAEISVREKGEPATATDVMAHLSEALRDWKFSVR
jgi:NAD(P)H-hydrate epimerase